MAASDSSSSYQLFSGGKEMANLILSTGVLQKGWNSITKLEQDQRPFVVDKSHSKFTIVAFNICSPGPQDFNPALEPLHSTESPLSFLITKDNTKISIHRSSLSVFLSLLTDDLEKQLKELTGKKQPQLILVGRSLGGSVAALVTLWLLKNRSSPSLPICITYGSPSIGDAGLQKAISKIGRWKTHFWHILGHEDIVPRVFLVPNLTTHLLPGTSAEFKPFGTYFFCTESACTCIDHPDSVFHVLQISSANLGRVDPAQLHQQNYNYGSTFLQLKKKIEYRSNAQPHGNSILQIGLSLQLEATGITDSQGRDQLLRDMQKEEEDAELKRRCAPDPSRKFNEVKKQMALLEWYMKTCQAGDVTYYDCFKGRGTQSDIDVIKMRNILNKYWKEKVEESENNPQTPDVPLRDRWLFAGTTYRRVVEPLDIAEYYRRRGNRDYVKKGRSPHYIVLENWHKETAKPNKKEKAASLTEDSCFWAYVEEAALNLKELKSGKAGSNSLLKEFEDYVWNSICNRELSTTVFLQHSGFMTWWEEYEKMLDRDRDSDFIRFMRDKDYRDYK